MKSLKEEYDLVTMMYLDMLPAEIMEIIAASSNDTLCTQAAENALKVGDVAPDFSLFDANTGKIVSTASLKEQGPLVINFFRGSWCAYCTTELKQYGSYEEEVGNKGASIVSVSPETVDILKATADKENVSDMKILSDSKLQVAKCFGIAFDLSPTLIEVYKDMKVDIPKFQDTETWILPIPATYVVGTDGKIVYAHVNSDPFVRAEPSEVLAAIPEQIDESVSEQPLDGSSSSITSLISSTLSKSDGNGNSSGSLRTSKSSRSGSMSFRSGSTTDKPLRTSSMKKLKSFFTGNKNTA